MRVVDPVRWYYYLVALLLGGYSLMGGALGSNSFDLVLPNPLFPANDLPSSSPLASLS